MATPKECTCWYGSYVKIEGGTGFDIARYDKECPYHFPEEEYVDSDCGESPEDNRDEELVDRVSLLPEYDLYRDRARGK